MTGDPSEPNKPLQTCSVIYVSDCSSGESDEIYIGATQYISVPSDKEATNSVDSKSKTCVKKQPLLIANANESSEHLAEGLREKEEEEICEEALLRERDMEHENKKANSDASVRGAAGEMDKLKQYLYPTHETPQL